MRFLYACLAGFGWIALIAYMVSKGIPKPSDDIQLLTLAIIIAGALAGGD